MPGYAANTEKRNNGQTEQEKQPQHQQTQKYRNKIC